MEMLLTASHITVMVFEEWVWGGRDMVYLCIL